MQAATLPTYLKQWRPCSTRSPLLLPEASSGCRLRLQLLLLLLLPLLLPAQRLPKPEALTTEDGLGFRDIKAIAQDSRGLMWIGTAQGLERYDGLRFLRYGSNAQADFPFPGNSISNENMLMVNDSSLWLLADDVLYALDLRTQKTTNLSEAAGLTGKVYTLRQAADGTIWIATDDDREQQLLRYLGNHRFQKVATAQHLRMPFNDIAIDAAGNAWWSTNAEGLRLFSPNGNLLHAAKLDSIDWYGTKIYYANISTDRRGRLFVFPKSKNEIWLYHPETRQHEVLAEKLSARVYTMLEDARGNYWFATFDGLLHWSPTGEWTDLTATLHSSLQFTNIHHLYEDRTHLLWIATDNGLLRFPIGRDLFETYLTVPGAVWGNSMRGIFADQDDNVYAFCETGQRGLHQLGDSQQKNRLLFPYNDSLSLALVFGNVFNFVFDKKENAAWTLNNNLLKIDLSSRQSTIFDNFDGVSGKMGRNPLCLLKDGNIALGSILEKLTIYDPESRQRSRLFPQGLSGIPATNVSGILEDINGSIWVGTTSEGVICFNRQGEKLAHFSTQTKPALSNDHVLSLLFDSTGKLWVGTFGGGLNCLSGNLTHFKNWSNLVFNKTAGLCDNNVVSILEDDGGNIWAATYNGLACYRVEENTFRNFYEEDGLSNNEFNYASFFKDGRGGLWFGGMNGINYFDPEDVLQAEQNPPLCLTGFTKYSSRTDQTLAQTIDNELVEGLVISPDDSWFQINWTLPNYFKPDKNQYFVRLEGLEEDWSFIGSTPFVRYNKLPPGEYVLRVKGSDSKGNWSSSELAVPITVRPSFYQTWWFYLLVLALVAGISFAISRYRYQRRLEMEQMRTKIASDLHDEVGSMLSGLAMQAEILELQGPAADLSALSYLKDVSRTAVSKMRDMVWSIDSRRDRVEDLLDRMREHTEETFPLFNISYQFETAGLRLTQKLPVNVRQNLFLIFKEAVTNICKHSGADRAEIFFGNREGCCELCIWDNGTLPENKKKTPSTGLGMSNMQMRAEALGAAFSMENNQGFLVKIRLKKPL